jgi:hypothetical protein
MKAYQFCLPIALFGLALFSTSCQKEFLQEDERFALSTTSDAHTQSAVSLNTKAAEIQLAYEVDDSGGTKLNSDDAIRDDYNQANQADNSGGTTLQSDDAGADNYSQTTHLNTAGTQLQEPDNAIPDTYKNIRPQAQKNPRFISTFATILDTEDGLLTSKSGRHPETEKAGNALENGGLKATTDEVIADPMHPKKPRHTFTNATNAQQ